MVAQLRAEGVAADEGEDTWKRWSKNAQTLFSLEPIDGVDEGRLWKDVVRLGLGKRLGVDEWGRNILVSACCRRVERPRADARLQGQELRQRDHLHPLPLPSNYLYGNMMFE